MSDSNRSIAFVMEGGRNKPDLLLSVTELPDGTLSFEYSVAGKSELRGLYFDFNNSPVIDNLRVAGAQVTHQAVGDEAITKVSPGNNMRGSGSKFDVGMTFGSPGRGRDVTSDGAFVLFASDGTPLTLDDIANVEFGARLASQSLKLVAISPAAPDANDDTVVTDEDNATDEAAPNSNFIANDTDADGDALTIVAVDGDEALVGNQFALATGGLLTVFSDGSYDFDPDGQYEDLAVGESRADSFSYRITDSLGDPNNQGFDTATVNITVNGVNDAPIISMESGDSVAETVVETDATLTTAGTLTVTDVDVTDVVTPSVVSVVTGGTDSDPSLPGNATLQAMMSLTPTAPAPILDGTETTDSQAWSFDSAGEAFNYLATDEFLTLAYTLKVADDNGAFDEEVVTITVDGTNDQPAAEDIFALVGEDDFSVSAAFDGSDKDRSDVLRYAILAQPVDSAGNQYGEVINNGNGTFTFRPLDNFQFLDAGETRDVSFQYVAIDDSGVGVAPGGADESESSDAATITITVVGADDAPVDFADRLLFETVDQSMFGTGAALVLQPDLPFYGFNETYPLNSTIIAKQTFSGDTLEGILEGIEAVAQVFADIGCGIVNFFGGDCEAEVDLPSSISTPGVTTTGAFAAKVGLQPYFFLTSGDVDSQIPVDVFFQVPRQVENGETISVSSVYSVDGGASFDTMSPNVNFGMDFVFDLDTNLNLNLTSSTFGAGSTTSIWNVDTGNISGFTGELGEPGFNLFNFSAEDDLETSIELGDIATLDLNFPVIETTGTADPNDAETLVSSGEDDVAVLDIDVDAVIAELLKAVGVSIKFGDSNSFGLSIDVAGASVNLLSFSYNWDIVAVNLITTLKAVQDFTLEVQDLPLMAVLEDGSNITGFSLGEAITIDIPATSSFDPDVDGDADGLLDFDVMVDMDAVFSNDTWLGLDLDLFAGLLRFDGDVTSDFFETLEVSLFDDIIESQDNNNDGYLFGNTFPLASDVRLATLFKEEFAIEGWNTASTDTNLWIDIA